MPNTMGPAGHVPPSQDGRWPFFPLAFLQDAARFLALADQGQLRLDGEGRLQISSVRRLAAQAILRPKAADPRSEMQAPGLSLVVGLLGQAGYVGTVEDVLHLSAAAHEWLGSPAPIQLARLRDTWWLAPAVNTRWLPWDRRQRPLDSQWRALILEVCRWVAALPTGDWTPGADLYRQGAIAPPTAGYNLPRVRRAVRRQALGLAGFLLEVALPRLGLTEIRGEGDLFELRAAPQGADWLQAALERADLLARPPQGAAVELAVPAGLPRLPLGGNAAVVVEAAATGVEMSGGDASSGQSPPASRRDPAAIQLWVPLAAPCLCTFEVAHFAEFLSAGPPGRYRITRDSLERAAARGYPVADVVFMLERFGERDLPPSALDQFGVWQAEMKAIACEPGYRLRTVAPGILAALRRREPFRRRTAPLANGQDAWVGRADARDLFRYLRRTGYVLSLPQDPNDWPLQPPQRQPLPLAQLLVVLRTYKRLRRLVPGLAVLGLQDLERALVRSLPSDDLAGVERLVDSHGVMLEHHVGRLKGRESRQAGDAESEAQVDTDARRRRERHAVRPPVAEDRLAALSGGDLADRLQDAVETGTSLEITYADTRGHVTRRRVRPLHLETRGGREVLHRG